MNYKRYNTLLPDFTPLPVELDWYPRDTKENFEKQTKEFQEKWNKREKITYKLNKYGFRSGEFSNNKVRDSITFIGCSNTFGIGLQKNLTWPSLVAKEMNLEEINLAIPGGSLDSAFRVYNEWQRIHRSKYTCLLIPPGKRLELIKDKKWRNVGHWSENQDDLKSEFLLNLLDEDLQEVNHERNLAAISHLAHITDSKLTVIDQLRLRPNNDLWPLMKGPAVDARDNMHYGEEFHSILSKIFIYEMNN
jgi:hypothetical protein